MTLAELYDLVGQGESDSVEFKETTGQRGEACRTLCAFLNGDGGCVVFGVSRKGSITGQLVSDDTKRDLAHAISEIEPLADVSVEYVPVDAVHVAIVCRVRAGLHKPYVYDGRPYRRIQSTTSRMPLTQYDLLLSRRGGFRSVWELESNPSVTLEDVDVDEVKRTARIAMSEGRLAVDVDISDSADLLRRFGLLRDGRVLNGAMVLFGKNLVLYPQCMLKMAWFKGRDKLVFLDNRLVSGNVIHLQSEAMSFCFKHLNLSGVVRGLYREEQLEIPVEALREALINALAHRLYDTGGAVSLAIYEDRVEISNPGSFNPECSAAKAFAGMASSPRNPAMAKVLYLRKAIEMWGRGIGLIFEACEKAGLEPPKIYEDRGFVYTVFKRPLADAWRQKTTVGDDRGKEDVETGKEDGEAVEDHLLKSGQENLNRGRKSGQERPCRGRKSGQESPCRGQKTGCDSMAYLTQLNLKSTDAMILKKISADAKMTIFQLQSATGLSHGGVCKALKRLTAAHIIRRIGPDNGGRREILIDMTNPNP